MGGSESSSEGTAGQGWGARGTTGSSAVDFSQEDAAFIRETLQSGMTEIKMGELARQNAQDQLKDFGQRLIDDHTRANDELARLAAIRGLDAPSQMGVKGTEAFQHLSRLGGAEFDRACARQAVDAHVQAIKSFRLRIERTRDAELKAFAQKTLQLFEDDLAMARKLMGN